MKTNSVFGILAALALVTASACTSDARGDAQNNPSPADTDDTADAGTTDAGPVDDDTPDAGPVDDVDEGDLADVYTLTFVAPVGATEVVLEGNLRGDWNDELLRVHDRTLVWRGRLTYGQLDRPACTANARAANCGYVVTLWFDVEPYFSCVLDPAGNFRDVSKPSVEGPLRVEAVSVDNGLDGCNYHLRLIPAEPR